MLFTMNTPHVSRLMLSSPNDTLTQMLGLAGFNSQQAAAAGLAGGRNPFTQQVSFSL